ncbi:MAG: hypothetical protein HOE45_08565, partial [Gammaproteobacteria bacterium]|nr:hypothetical protein [Gammaproteobacteria bacterium]
MRWIIYSVLLSLSIVCVAAEQPFIPTVPGQEKQSQDQADQKKQETWWEKRDERSDIYYPHKLHYEVMEEEGDSCLLCHAFQKNDE